MACRCIKVNRECDGCGECGLAPVKRDLYGSGIYLDEYYYDFNGDIVAEDNIDDYLEQFRKTATM